LEAERLVQRPIANVQIFHFDEICKFPFVLGELGFFRGQQRSSAVLPKARAILKPSSKLGSYLPVSRALIAKQSAS
jgi:hypothetical protein